MVYLTGTKDRPLNLCWLLSLTPQPQKLILVNEATEALISEEVAVSVELVSKKKAYHVGETLTAFGCYIFPFLSVSPEVIFDSWRRAKEARFLEYLLQQLVCRCMLRLCISIHWNIVEKRPGVLLSSNLTRNWFNSFWQRIPHFIPIPFIQRGTSQCLRWYTEKFKRLFYEMCDLEIFKGKKNH